MKPLILYLPLLVCCFAACRKDDQPVEQKIVDPTTSKERFIAEFCEYEAQLYVGLTAHGSCNSDYMNQLFRFKLIPFGFSADKYFYKIQKHSDYNYAYYPHTTDWTETEGLYRYDFENKKSYHYIDENDADPRLLMDFNLIAGDSIFIDSTDYGPIFFYVTATETVTMDGTVFPALKGFMTSHANSGLQVGNEIYLAPFYPNPVWIDHNFVYYTTHDFTLDNFANTYSYGSGHADEFAYVLIHTPSSTQISFDRLYYCW